MHFRFGMMMVLGLALCACSQEGLEIDDQESIETEAASTGRAYWTLFAHRAQSIYSGSIGAINVGGPTILRVDITEGPDQLDVSCTRRLVAGCELTVCSEGGEEPGPFADVGPVRFEGDFEFDLAHDGERYAEAFQPQGLWSEPGDFVEISYRSEGRTVRTRQAAPALGLNVTQHLPVAMDRRRAETILWTGGQRRDQGSMSLSLMTTDDDIATADGGWLPRVMLTCRQAPAKAGRFTLQPSMMAALPPGNYMAVAQTESNRIDSNGITHSLIAVVDNAVTPVVLQ